MRTPARRRSEKLWIRAPQFVDLVEIISNITRVDVILPNDDRRSVICDIRGQEAGLSTPAVLNDERRNAHSSRFLTAISPTARSV